MWVECENASRSMFDFHPLGWNRSESAPSVLWACFFAYPEQEFCYGIPRTLFARGSVLPSIADTADV